MSKELKYLMTLLGLVVANLFFLARSRSGKDITELSYFNLTDTSEVSMIRIETGENSVKIERKESGWSLNDTHQVDPRFKDILLTLIQRVRIKREVGDWKQKEQGFVTVQSGQDEFHFGFSSNPNRTKSYFVQDGKSVEVEVPGYRDNVADIFLLLPDQWRDRLLFDGSWRTIQALTIEYQDDPNVEIRFHDKFFRVNQEASVDSTKLVNYLNQFQFFEANEMISKGRFPKLDSLLETNPLASITIQDIKYEQPVIMRIFPRLDGDSFHLVHDERSNQQAVVNAKRIENLLKFSDDFLLD